MTERTTLAIAIHWRDLAMLREFAAAYSSSRCRVADWARETLLEQAALRRSAACRRMHIRAGSCPSVTAGYGYVDGVKGSQLSINMRPAEKRQIEAAARRDGAESTAHWCRQVLLWRAGAPVRQPPDMHEVEDMRHFRRGVRRLEVGQ